MNYCKKETILLVENVSKSYDGKLVLRDINFDVKNIIRDDCPTQGQVISLVGRSGSGKSTMLNILSSLLVPDSGKITSNQHSLKLGDAGVVFQDSFIYPWRTVKTILEMAAKKNPQTVSINELVVALDISQHLQKYSYQLSGGQRQRVAIAEQILNGCDIILLDEPFSGLDTIAIDKVLNILTNVSMMDDLKTIIIVSHDLSNSLAISDSVFVLAKEGDKEGATITHQIDLLERNLAWRKDIKDVPEFRELIKEVKTYL